MNLLLINPPERQLLRSNLPVAIESLRGNNPPIGLLYVAAAAHGIDGWRTEVIDAHAGDLDTADLARETARRKPDLVGITATSFTYLDVLETARAAKSGRPECKVLLGGVHPFHYPRESLAQPEVDLVFSGEAEASFPQLLELWREEGPDALNAGRVPGLLAKGDDVGGFQSAPVIETIDSVPMPAWDAVPVGAYSSLITNVRPVTILITSRGCPYRCRYCALSPTGKRWRAHGPERVVREMSKCRDLGIGYLLFYDEVFTVNRKRVLEICESIRTKGLNLPWMARATPDTVDDEICSSMRQAGCEWITFGVEAGNPAVLERLGRKQSIDEILGAFRSARNAGMRTIAYFMLGNPGETLSEMDDSLRLAKRLRPDMVHASLFMPYPASAIYQDDLADGKIQEDYWRQFAQHPDIGYRPPYGNQNFSDEQLEYLLLRFYRRYSFRLRFLIKKIKEIRSSADVRTGLKAVKTMMAGFFRPFPADKPR